jgi:hypothetical protein
VKSVPLGVLHFPLNIFFCSVCARFGAHFNTCLFDPACELGSMNFNLQLRALSEGGGL